jgi:hypothetical protein
MKTLNISKGLLLGIALLLATSAFAAEKGTLTISDPVVTLGGTQLKAGTYTVQWDGNGPKVQLNILRGKSVVAASPARVVNTGRAPSTSSYSMTSDASGAQALSEIRLHGKKYVLEIGGEAAPETASTTK